MVQPMCWNLFAFQRPLHASAAAIPAPGLGWEAKVSTDCLHDMRAKAAPLIFGSRLGGLILTGSFFFCFIFQREIIKLLLA